MARSIRANTNRVGRPKTTGKGTLVGVRLLKPALTAIDAFAAKEDDAPSRPEAIRRLVDLGLAGVRSTASTSKKTAAKAAELAGTMIDWLGDKSAPPEEQAKRKRRLVKGPSEFREMRDDLPKPKG